MKDIDHDKIEVTMSYFNNDLGFQWNRNSEQYVYCFDEPEDEQEGFRLMDQKIKTLIGFLENNIH